MNEARYSVYNTREDFDNIRAGDDKIVTINPVLDGDKALPYTLDRKEGEIGLDEFVAKAIEVLDNPGGFFIMAEGGKVDWACHANDAVATVLDVLSLDDAVKVAYEFYQKHPDETLIVVTGDHETGGMTVGFAGTKYDSFLTKLQAQKGSYIAFNTEFTGIRDANPDLKFEDTLPLVESYFGLKRYTQSEKDTLNEQAKAGDVEAYEALGMALSDYEIEDLKKAFNWNLKAPGERPVSTDESYYLAYGIYEPFTVKLTHILNHKAGIGWTSYSHTGLPTPVSVVGVGHQLFNGYYDKPIFSKKLS